MNTIRARIAASLAAWLFAGATHAQTVPAGDYHQHVFSAADIAMIGPSAGLVPLDADQLVPLLDAAGIERAVLLSIAYMAGSPSRKVDDEVAKVRMENDWTAAQAARYSGRLIAFCSFNPLKDYALAELERCAKTPGLDHGIKLHVGNSDVQLENPAHVARLRQVFAAANAHGMAIVIHLRANIGKRRPYGAAQARIFLDQILPAAPDVVVQVAHFAGSGPGYDDPPAQAAMAVLADAVENHDPLANNLWFDVASIVDRDIRPETAALVVKFIRRVGVGRVLYGTDSAQGANLRPRESWAAFQKLPLSPAEFAHIAANVPPYFPSP
jgi:predicted TIM-barrel fold metal-dependent hydrolase